MWPSTTGPVVLKAGGLKEMLSILADQYMYEPRGGGGGCGVSANEYSCANGAQINFGDLGNSISLKNFRSIHWSYF